MCGIVGAIAQRDVSAILMEGLKRLEYRGYDSAGLALLEEGDAEINCIKTAGRVQDLIQKLDGKSLPGRLGIAHTRWATHGEPNDLNAHPHLSHNEIALIHNGIIENFESLKTELISDGYVFATQTDSETIVHLIHRACNAHGLSLVDAVKESIGRLEGAYGLCVINKSFPDRVVVARSGSPLVIGIGIGENFIASDAQALGQVTDRFIYLEEGDIAEITLGTVTIWNNNELVNRSITHIKSDLGEVEKGEYSHYMLKEIHQQPQVIKDTLDGRISRSHVLEEAFGVKAKDIFDKVKSIQIVACGTSYHAGQIAKYWFESIAKIPCQVDIASDYRYRNIIVNEGTLFVSISQSGETADTLAALRFALQSDYVSRLAICNVATILAC